MQGDDDDICAGYFYAKSTPSNIKLLEKVIQYVNTWVDDQTALRRFLNEEEGLAHRLTSKKDDLSMTLPVDGSSSLALDLKAGLSNYLVLPRLLFPNGTAYFNIKFPQRFGVVPFIVHNNCIIGHDSKVDRFKMYDMWYIGGSNDIDFAEESKRIFSETNSTNAENAENQPNSLNDRIRRPLFKLTPHREVVTCLSLHPDQSTIYTAAYDKTVKTYRVNLLEQAKSDSEVPTIRPSGGGLLNRRGGVWCMAWKVVSNTNVSLPQTPQASMDSMLAILSKNLATSPALSQPQCFTGGHDRHVLVWETDHGLSDEVFANPGPWKETHKLKGHLGVVNDILYHRDLVFSASDDCTVRSWDPIKGEKTRIFRAGGKWISAIAADGPALFAASADHCAYAWEIATARLMQVYIGHTGWVRTIIVNGASKRVYTAGSDASIKEWDMISGDCLRTIQHAHEGGINKLIFGKRRNDIDSSSKPTVLYSCGDDGLIRAWDLESLQFLAQYEGHKGPVTCILQVKSYLISGGADHTVNGWSCV